MATDRWFFPTSTNNLKAIFTHGLICGSVGYKKYYADVSNDFPGFIPIFRNGKGEHVTALSKAKKEGDNLTICLLEINLDQIESGSAYLLDGREIDVNTREQESEQPDEILLPSPLSLSCVKQVVFKTSKEKSEFEGDIKYYGNTPQGALKLAVATTKYEKNLFEILPISGRANSPYTGETDNSPSDQQAPSAHQIDYYKKIYSLGGLFCTLFYFAKNGPVTNNTFVDCGRLRKLENADNSLPRHINNYFHQRADHKKSNNPQAIILYSILDILVKQEKNEHITSIVNFLKSEVAFDNESEKTRAKELSERLAAFYHSENIDSKSSVLFAGSSSKVEKILLLLAYRNDVPGLIGTDIAELNVFDEEDYINAAMLFGARSKYHKIPLSLRQYPGMQDYISYLMAQYAHSIRDTGITFRKPQVPPTVMEMVTPKSKKLNWYGFINWFANKLKIINCFETIIPNKKYLNDDGKSTYDGIVLPKITIKNVEYFKAMSMIEIDYKSYETILKKFRSL